MLSTLDARARTSELSEEGLKHLLNIADTLSARGDERRGWRALHIVEQAADHTGRPTYLAEAAIHRGILHHRKGELRHAIVAWEDALRQFSALDQTEGVANCRTNLGITYKAIRDMDQAQRHLQAALDRSCLRSP